MKGLKVLAFAFLAALFLVGTGIAQQPFADHCQTGFKQNVQYAAAAATTTSLIPPITGTNIYVCGYSIAQAGGTGTILLEYGTGSLCGTGTQIMSATYTANSSAGTASYITTANHGFTQMNTSVPASPPAMVPSQRICALTTGTIAQSLQLVFVQE